MRILIFSIYSILILLTIVSLADSTPVGSTDGLSDDDNSSDIKVGLLPSTEFTDLHSVPENLRSKVEKTILNDKNKALVVAALSKELKASYKSYTDNSIFNRLRIYRIPKYMDNFVLRTLKYNTENIFSSFKYKSSVSLAQYTTAVDSVKRAYRFYKNKNIVENKDLTKLYENFVIYPAIVTHGQNVSAFFFKDQMDEYILPEKTEFGFDDLIDLYEYLKDQASIVAQENVIFNDLRKCVFFSKLNSRYIPHIIAGPECILEHSSAREANKRLSIISIYKFISYLMYINDDTATGDELTSDFINTMIRDREKNMLLPALDTYFTNINWATDTYYKSITGEQRNYYAKLSVEYVFLQNLKLAQNYRHNSGFMSLMHNYGKVNYTSVYDTAFSKYSSLQGSKPLSAVKEKELIDNYVLLSPNLGFDFTRGKAIAMKSVLGGGFTTLSKLVRYANDLRENEIIKSNPNILVPVHISKNGGTYKVYFESRKNYLIRGDHFLCKKKTAISKCKFIPFDLNTMKAPFKQVFKAIDDIYKTGIPFSIESVNLPKDIIYDSYTGEFSVIPTVSKFWKTYGTCARGKLPKTLIDMEKETVFCLGLYYISMRGFSHDFFGPFSVRDKKDFQESIAISIALIQSKSEKNLVSKMLHWDPSKRASLMEVYNHSFWEEIESDEFNTIDPTFNYFHSEDYEPLSVNRSF